MCIRDRTYQPHVMLTTQNLGSPLHAFGGFGTCVEPPTGVAAVHVRLFPTDEHMWRCVFYWAMQAAVHTQTIRLRGYQEKASRGVPWRIRRSQAQPSCRTYPHPSAKTRWSYPPPVLGHGSLRIQHMPPHTCTPTASGNAWMLRTPAAPTCHAGNATERCAQSIRA